jgi:hypothetical protein
MISIVTCVPFWTICGGGNSRGLPDKLRPQSDLVIPGRIIDSQVNV